MPVTWKIVPLDTAADALPSYKYTVGSTEFWCAVQVRNHRYPIAKLEYLNADDPVISTTLKLFKENKAFPVNEEREEKAPKKVAVSATTNVPYMYQWKRMSAMT